MKDFHQDQAIRDRKGQTIIEAMIALSILITGLLGIMALLGRSFFLNRVTADELTATYLAAEGIELAKNLIDHDVYSRLAQPPQGTGWGSVWNMSVGETDSFRLDSETCTQAAACVALPFVSNMPLRYNTATHLYGYGGPGKPSAFTREIRVSVLNISELVVHSIVTWDSGPITSRSLDLEDHFYNWRS